VSASVTVGHDDLDGSRLETPSKWVRNLCRQTRLSGIVGWRIKWWWVMWSQWSVMQSFLLQAWC